jgi:ABC-2 type transport system ATP-binding protein
MAAVRSLDSGGVTPDDITLRRPTLDDVFLAYTGKSVEGEDGATNGPKRRRKRRGA